MKTQYSFVTTWELKASLPSIWEAIYNSTDWSNWWQGVVSVEEISVGDKNGIGTIRAYTWKSVLPYQLTFAIKLTEIEIHKKLSGIAFGELEGNGTWVFEEKNGVTKITYYWNVITNKSWMNYFSFILKPLFEYNHNIIMRWGATSLARKLDAELIRY
jgi:hypothetical protein